MAKAKHDRERINRLLSKIEVLEARNERLRAEVERLAGNAPVRWTPFQEAIGGILGNGLVIENSGENRMYVNNRYQVALYADGNPQLDCVVTHLSIKRNDGAAIHDWREFQRIKNELVGPEAEGIELYPAESRLVDGANQYHLFCVKPPRRWPVGFAERLVSEDNSEGVQQRPFPEDTKPADAADAPSFGDMLEQARKAGLVT